MKKFLLIVFAFFVMLPFTRAQETKFKESEVQKSNSSVLKTPSWSERKATHKSLDRNRKTQPFTIHRTNGKTSSTKAVWDVLYSFDAGGAYYAPFMWGEDLYVSKWNDTIINGTIMKGRIFKFEWQGSAWAKTDSVVVTGVTGPYNFEGFTTDDNFIYGVNESDKIFKIDPTTWTSTTITVTGAPIGIAYDAVNDGFWLSDYRATTARLVSRTGTSTGQTLTGGSSASGLAYDNITAGGPYLWLSSGTSGNGLHRWTISSGLFEADVHSTTDIPGITDEQNNMAGIGMGIDTRLGKMVFLGISEGNGGNYIFGYDFGDYAVNLDIPAAPTALTTTADPTGLTSCVLSWTNPALTVGGDALTDLTSVVIKRNGTIVHTTTSPTIGAVETWTDNSPVTGNNTYIVYGVNSEGDGRTVSKDVLVGTDATVVEIQNPVNGPNLTATQTVEVTVKNLGVATITSLPIKLEVNGTVVATETITASIPSMTEHVYTFTATADLSTVQIHNIKAYTELPNDGNRTNDTVLKPVINYGNLAVMGSVASITSCDIPFVDDGDDQNYSATPGEQMITFLPSTTGNRVKVTFNELATTIDPYLGDYGYYDALFVLNGVFTNPEEVTNEDVLAAFVGDYTDNLPAPIISESTDGALTFYFSKNNMLGEPSSGWDANISCITPLAKDAGVTSIISPAEISGATATVKVKVKNHGGDPITSMNVAYILNNNDPVVHAYTGNIIGTQSAEIEFTAPINLPEYGTYDLKVYTDLAEDMDRSNDTMKTTFAYKAPVKLYAYRTFDIDENDMGFVSFMSNSPETVTLESAYEDGSNSVRGGEFFDNELYVYTASGNPIVPVNFIKLTSGWSSVSTTTTTGVPNDVTYDYTTSTMFAAAGPSLYTIDMQTGEFTTITSSMTANILTLACSHDGRLYAVSTAGDFYSVNKTDGELTLVGATGFVPNFIQSMAFDHNTGRLFWAFMKGTSAADAASYLLEIDPVTGKAVNLGNLGASATEMLVLYTPYDGIGINTVSLPNSNIKIYPNPVTDKVIIENAAGTTAKIFDVSGKVLLEAKIQKDKESINLNKLTTGVYFIDLQGKDTKTTTKLIKK